MPSNKVNKIEDNLFKIQLELQSMHFSDRADALKLDEVIKKIYDARQSLKQIKTSEM